jgi:uncharacterized protein (TIGR03382 family)
MSTRFLFAAAITATSLTAAANAALYVPFNQADPVGSGWTQSMAPNDDGSSAQIDMGMTFCFYQTDHTALFINNNGNVTFDGGFSTFTPFAFPSSARPMIAPFFADVDTRNRGHAGSGTNLVWHKSVDSDNNGSTDLFVVTWDTVGYFNGQVDKLNTFQLVLSADENGFGTGLNAAFSYGDMNWTTGSASGGVGGFGGAAATVGINRGDGIDFDQIGRFDNAGSNFDPNNGGVNYLDNRLYFFNACQGIVPAPGTLGFLGLAGLAAARRRRD